MNSRREFLLQLFRLLDERTIAYCVLRNFDEVFAHSDSDVDLLARSSDVPGVQRATEDAAAQCGFRLVQRTRFVNHSAVFWDGGIGFVRLDLDTEVRWRCWPVLTAQEVLAERIRYGDFFIPSAHHEASILRTQMVWQGGASERYLRRLAELDAAPGEVSAWRRAIVHNCATRLSRWALAAGYFAQDISRWWHRWRNPPGAVIEIFSAAPVDPAPIFVALSSLFPPAKGAVFAPGQSVRTVVFKGGLAIRCHPRPPEPIHPAAPRTFVVAVADSGAICVASATDGGMAECFSIADTTRFILECCAREFQPPPTVRKGAVLALVGLDGAGKTTFARQICAASWSERRFPAVHYCHWLPALGCHVEFPWPHMYEVARKPPMVRHAGTLVLSAMRLAKNLLLARLIWRWRVRPWVRRGHLVLLDRFLYNYWLDPDSVRSTAPRRWLEWARALLPQPNWLIVLEADAETLRTRKAELSIAQIAEQTNRLRQLPPLAQQRMNLNARHSPAALAQQMLETVRQAPS